MHAADYVVVGAGSAGCAVATRLSEDPSCRVVLIEAGGSNRHPNITIPAAFPKQFRTKLDWDFNSEPEPYCDNRSLYLPRGKSLGGSSSMNAQLYVRGRPFDYDLWEAQGATGWGWRDVLPYFKRAEDNSRGASEYHGAGGPLRVEDSRDPQPFAERFLQTAEEYGIPRIPDYNGPEQDGCSPVQVTQRAGRRWSSADAYLRPAMKRTNLTVVTKAQVLGIELDGERAVGVRYADKRGRERVAHAAEEVIISAGAYGSPQLLMLSGIGPEAALREVGVQVRHDLPGVGENLQDHPYLVGIWASVVGETLADAETPKNVLRWLVKRDGPFSSSVAEAFAFVRTRPGLPAADIQYHFAPVYFSEHGFDESYTDHAITFGSTLVSPKSRGWVRLRSSDPTAKPRILTNTLQHPDDMASIVAGVRMAREMAALEPMRSALGKELFPGVDVQSDIELEEDIRRRVELLYHPVGTCRIGQDDMAVVDPELKVRGIDRLRVADASVMPVITGGNTNAPTIMIGEKAADLIRGRVAAGSAA
jgi:choline dehydrogenase-like flavoprotein